MFESEITIKKIKEILLNILIKLNSFYLFLNQELLFAWRRFLSKQSDNRINYALRVLIEKPATALFLNTILFYSVSIFLAGGLGIIGITLKYIAMLNIFVFAVSLLDWKGKLKG